MRIGWEVDAVVDWDGLSTRLCAELPGVIRDLGVGSVDLPDDRYVQWAGFPEGLQLEVVSNAFLEEPLTFSERRALQLLDWCPPAPPDVPNFFRRFDNPVPVADAVQAIVTAARVLVGGEAADPVKSSTGQIPLGSQPDDELEDIVSEEDEDPWAGLLQDDDDDNDHEDDDDNEDQGEDEEDHEDDDELTRQSTFGGMSAPELLKVALGRSWAVPDVDDRTAAVHQLLWHQPGLAVEALLALAVDADLDHLDRLSVVEIAVSVGPAVGLAVVWVFEQTLASHASSEDWLELRGLQPDAQPHHWLAAYAAVMRSEQLDNELRAEAAARLWFESRTDAALQLVIDTLPHRWLAYSLYEQNQKHSPYAGALLEQLAESESVPWRVRVDAAEWLLVHDEVWQTTGERVLLDLLRSDSAPAGVRARALQMLRDTGRPDVLASVLDPSWDEGGLLMAMPEDVIERHLAPFDAVVVRAIAAEFSVLLEDD